MKFINIQMRDGEGGYLIPNDEEGSGRTIADNLLGDADNMEMNEFTGEEEISKSIKDIIKEFNIPEQSIAGK